MLMLRKYLHTLPGFAFMTDEDVDHIADAMRVDDYYDDHIFIDQEKPAKAFYLVLKGTVTVSFYGKSGRRYTLRKLGPGDFFGALSLVDGKPAMACYATEGAARVASMPQSAFLLLHQPNSALGCHFQHVIATQLAEDLKVRHEVLHDLLARMYPVA